MGRYSSIDRCNRICNVCNSNKVESEYHFLLCCPFYSSLRTNYFGKLPWLNVQLFVNMLSSNQNKMILKIAKYLRDAFNLRNEQLQNAITT